MYDLIIEYDHPRKVLIIALSQLIKELLPPCY